MALIHETIPDFTDEEFAVLEDAGRIDCIFVEGEKKYFSRFFETLTATHPDIDVYKRQAIPPRCFPGTGTFCV